MADYGLKISQPFYDATTAADANLIFSSSWPTLPIAAEATFTNSLFGGTSDFSNFNLTYAHGLPFAPFSIAWSTVNSTGKTGRYLIPFDGTYAYLQPSTSLTSIHVTCYNINMAVDVEYPYLKTSGSKALYDKNFGIKIPKSGKEITSTDMRDFILHSRCQSPQILAVKTQVSSILSASGGGTRDIIYTPPVNTPLWAFGYQLVGTKYSFANYYSSATPRLFVDANSNGTYSYRLNYSGLADGATLIILRDPMFTSNVVSVTY